VKKQKEILTALHEFQRRNPMQRFLKKFFANRSELCYSSPPVERRKKKRSEKSELLLTNTTLCQGC
jgi:hypothetical protein